MNTSEMIECPTCATFVQGDLLIPAGDTHICTNCREEYAQRMKEGLGSSQSDEWLAIRHEHIKHEASLRSVGLLYYLIAAVLFIAGASMSIAAMGSMDDDVGGSMLPMMIGMLVFQLLFSLIFVFIGRGYRKLSRWVRIPGTICSGIGLLNLPVGTLINVYILYLMFSEKGRMIFSPEYREIREATPEVKYKTSLMSWIVLLLLIISLVTIIVMVTVSPAGS